jgi:hypothetical protein
MSSGEALTKGGMPKIIINKRTPIAKTSALVAQYLGYLS